MARSALELVIAEKWAIDQADGNACLKKIMTIAAREHNPADWAQAKDAHDNLALQSRDGRPLQGADRATLRDGVAIVPVLNPLFRRANLMTEFSGATSFDMLARDLRAALDAPDNQVRAVLLDIDSPGGMVNGTNEFAKLVAEAGRDSQKTVAAFVGYNATSAAYWIASAVPRGNLVVDETARLGSIGVVAAIIDMTERDRARGIRESIFVSSQSPDKRIDPDSDAGKAVVQAEVDALAQIFIDTVAEARGVTPEDVINDFGRGAVKIGADAVAAGMADQLGSFESFLVALDRGEITAGKGRQQMPLRRADDMNTDISAAELAGKYPKATEAIRREAFDEGKAAGDQIAEARVLADINGPDGPVAKAAAEALEKGKTEGRALGLIEGAKAERDRIAGLKASALPGYDELLQAAIEDGESTGADLAQKIVAAQKSAGAQYQADRKTDQAALDKLKLPDPSTVSDPKPKAGAGQDAKALARACEKVIAEHEQRGKHLTPDEAMDIVLEGQAA